MTTKQAVLTAAKRPWRKRAEELTAAAIEAVILAGVVIAILLR